jgi:short-subunit dehydrogenase
MKIIIIGATAGIGKTLAEIYINKGYEVGLTGRRINLLEEIKLNFHDKKIHIRAMDVADIDNSRNIFAELVEEMGGVDICVINAGVGFPNATFEQEINTIDINVRGFVALANASYNYFMKNEGGQIVGISSIASIRGGRHAPEYNASKSFVSSYMEGLRLRAKKKGSSILVTDIRPGFVDTEMTKSNKEMFWVATPEKAAQQIYEAISAKKKVAYITKRWGIIAFLLKIMPDFIYEKMV